MTLNLKNRKYTITKFLSLASAEHMVILNIPLVYEGYYNDGDKTNEVIFNVYTLGTRFSNPLYGRGRMEYFFNKDKNALEKLGRLIDVDEQNLILVTQKISGTTIKDALDFDIN
jgi:hypothetical protein